MGSGLVGEVETTAVYPTRCTIAIQGRAGGTGVGSASINCTGLKNKTLLHKNSGYRSFKKFILFVLEVFFFFFFK